MQIVADLVDDAVRKIRGRFVFEKNVRTRLIWHPCRGAEIFLGMLPVVSNAVRSRPPATICHPFGMVALSG